MASTVVNKSSQQILPLNNAHRTFFLAQICLRVFAMASTLAAAWIMLTSKQVTVVYGIQAEARYSYTPAFKLFSYVNLIACAFSALSLLLALLLRNKPLNTTYCFYAFLHDLIVSLLLIASCSAATAIGYVGKYGNEHAGWMALCGYLEKFCNKITAAALISYVGFAIYLMLTVISANKSRMIARTDLMS